VEKRGSFPVIRREIRFLIRTVLTPVLGSIRPGSILDGWWQNGPEEDRFVSQNLHHAMVRDKEELPRVAVAPEPELPCHDAGQRHAADPVYIALVSRDFFLRGNLLRTRLPEPDENIPEFPADDNIKKNRSFARHRD
jgi:hypothetical protein